MSDRAKSHMGGRGKRKPHSVHVKRGKSGGFVATHHHPTGETEEHVLSNKKQMLRHMAENMGDQPVSGTPPEEMPGQQPQPEQMQMPPQSPMGM